MARQYPSASHTFTVYRRNQTTKVGNNVVAVSPDSVAPISTGESILIRDLIGDIVNEKGAVVLDGRYTGNTFVDTPIMIGDIVADETENDIRGNPVRYEIMGRTLYAWYCKLHMRRNDVGA